MENSQVLNQVNKQLLIPSKQIYRLGVYLFTYSLNTRTCGSFSLCSPTKVALIVDDEVAAFIRETGAADNRRNDFEEVNQQCEKISTNCFFTF